MSDSDLSLYFDGSLGNLGAVASLVQQVCRGLELDETTSYHVELAVIEAVTNGIRHAPGGEGRLPMHVAASVEGDNLTISVSDRGRPVALRLPAEGEGRPPVPDELQEGGRGLFLICSLMDRVEHRSDAHGNTLLMTKTLRPTRGPV